MTCLGFYLSCTRHSFTLRSSIDKSKYSFLSEQSIQVIDLSLWLERLGQVELLKNRF